ncbi:hypothetical protein [Bradyrhizobium sp. STM 3557]|uniref:hypothetical protein n=1 Tax=Bradyrhizobium sp. STM 3557 TaxID=578920 RepID=UPI0038905BB0
MSDSNQSHDPNSLAYYAPPGSPDRKDPSMSSDPDGALAPQRRVEDLTPHLRIVKPNEARPKDSSDAFAAAVAMAMRQQQEAELLNASSVLQRRSSIPAAATFAVAIAGAALVALAYVVLFPQQPDQRSLTLLRPFAPTTQRPAPTLIVRNHSGTLNEPLELGVSVQPAEPGVTVTIKGLPVGAKLTAGEQMGLTEWRMAADDAANAVVIPPQDFAGDINLAAELRNADNLALVTSVIQLSWKAPPPPPAPVAAPAAPPPPQVAAAPAAPEPVPSPPAPRVDPSTNEVGGLVRRAQEMLLMGEVKAARALLLRAADARDAQAAYLLAKTYDPTLVRQSGAADAGPDLAQARSWYQKAREWGAPEAQRQLDALASYGR